MKSTYTPAFDALKAIGVPVYEHADDDGNFSIDAEASGASQWVSYYSPQADWVFGVSPHIDHVLAHFDLFAEWVNPGRLAVYPR